MSESSVSVLGRPSSGKSTFLAALYYALKQNGGSGLKLAELPDDVEYLDSILKKWEQFETVERTTMSIHTSVSLKLTDELGATVALNYPDLSGEEFDAQWKERTCDKYVVDSIRESSGVLFFIGPKIKEPLTIREVFGALGKDALEPQPRPGVFAPLDAPDDVVLVDLLQIVKQLRSSGRTRIALLFSAWDSIEKTAAHYSAAQMLPSDWCASRLPLLEQFLASSVTSLDVRMFGVSAQGGDLQVDRTELLKVNAHSDRIFVVEAGGAKHHDIRAPLDWLIGRST